MPRALIGVVRSTAKRSVLAMSAIMRRLLQPQSEARRRGHCSGCCPIRSDLIAENALLRQQLIVVRRGTKRPAFRNRDRTADGVVCARELEVAQCLAPAPARYAPPVAPGPVQDDVPSQVPNPARRASDRPRKPSISSSRWLPRTSGVPSASEASSRSSVSRSASARFSGTCAEYADRTAVAELEDLPCQPRRRNLGLRLRTNGGRILQTDLRFLHRGASELARGSLRGNSEPDAGVGSSTTSRGHTMVRGTAVLDPRERTLCGKPAPNDSSSRISFGSESA